MRARARLLILTGLVLAGCNAMQKVAVTSFRVLDAPANYIRRHIDQPPKTATTGTSDVSTPGRPIATASPPKSTPPPVPPKETTVFQNPPRTKPAPSAKPRSSLPQIAQFPTAKPVPGKPGYVFSTDPKGGIIDVTGYKSGDKAKDPFTQQVFIIP